MNRFFMNAGLGKLSLGVVAAGRRRRLPRVALASCLCLSTCMLLFQSRVLSAAPLQAEAPLPKGAVSEPGVLKVGMECNYAPFNWTQPNDKDGAVPVANSPGEYAGGYDVEIAKRVAEGLGLKLQIIKTEWGGLAPAVQSGKLDAIIAGMSPTAERKKILDFTSSYYYSDMVVVIRKDSKWAGTKAIQDFQDARMSSQIQTAPYTVLSQIKGGHILAAMTDFPTLTAALMADKIDGYTVERPGAMAVVAANPSLSFVSFDKESGFKTDEADTSIAVGLRKDSPLTERINGILDGLSSSERARIMQRAVDLNTGTGSALPFWASVGSLLQRFWPLFLRGAGVTLLISMVGTILGLLLGLLIAILRSIEVRRKDGLIRFILLKLLHFVLAAYVEIFRGTPMMVQAMLVFFGSKLFFNVDMTSMSAAFFIVTINTGAYLAEIVRGGIIAVDKGQNEAAKALGMSHGQTMTRIILPQALRSILPAIGNEFIINIKDTSVLNIIMVTELFFLTKSVAGSTLLTFQSYFIACAIYFVLTFTISRLLRLIERRMAGPQNYTLHEEALSNRALEA